MRAESEGILVLRRLSSSEDPPLGVRVPANPPPVGMGHNDTLARYRGIEGVVWPDSELAGFSVGQCLIKMSEEDKIKEYFNFISPFYRSDVLYCQVYREVPLMVSLVREFRFLGYDYGYALGEYDCYSVLFNEVIYGAHERLRSYAGGLNENLLVPSLELLKALDAERTSLLEKGEPGLETAYLDEPCQSIAVFDFREGISGS